MFGKRAGLSTSFPTATSSLDRHVLVAPASGSGIRSDAQALVIIAKIGCKTKARVQRDVKKVNSNLISRIVNVETMRRPQNIETYSVARLRPRTS